MTLWVERYVNGEEKIVLQFFRKMPKKQFLTHYFCFIAFLYYESLSVKASFLYNVVWNVLSIIKQNKWRLDPRSKKYDFFCDSRMRKEAPRFFEIILVHDLVYSKDAQLSTLWKRY